MHTYREITQESYPLPGREVTQGGRTRLTAFDGFERVTVGKRTTNFYRVQREGAKPTAWQQYRTKDVEHIAAEARGRIQLMSAQWHADRASEGS